VAFGNRYDNIYVEAEAGDANANSFTIPDSALKSDASATAFFEALSSKSNIDLVLGKIKT
jgi:hypothetical protein